MDEVKHVYSAGDPEAARFGTWPCDTVLYVSPWGDARTALMAWEHRDDQDKEPRLVIETRDGWIV